MLSLWGWANIIFLSIEKSTTLSIWCFFFFFSWDCWQIFLYYGSHLLYTEWKKWSQRWLKLVRFAHCLWQVSFIVIKSENVSHLSKFQCSSVWKIISPVNRLSLYFYLHIVFSQEPYSSRLIKDWQQTTSVHMAALLTFYYFSSIFSLSFCLPLSPSSLFF